MRQAPHKIETEQLIANCFRHEHGKLMSILVGLFGSHNFELAEDIIQDTLLEALKNWSYKGIPDNPSGWLYKVAKNKSLNALNRKKIVYELSEKVPDEKFTEQDIGELFSEEALKDEQLKMMFICCHPSISPEAQSCLILKSLCGFGIDEIARAFLSKTETITKRLMRARKVFRESTIKFELPGKPELGNRLDTVLKTIYLLYNEGYNASKGKLLIRKELCDEAIRLANFLASIESTNTVKTHALLALMYFNFSRFDQRLGESGEIIPLEHQNRKLWDSKSIALGFYHLSKITANKELSNYRLRPLLQLAMQVPKAMNLPIGQESLTFMIICTKFPRPHLCFLTKP